MTELAGDIRDRLEGREGYLGWRSRMSLCPLCPASQGCPGVPRCCRVGPALSPWPVPCHRSQPGWSHPHKSCWCLRVMADLSPGLVPLHDKIISSLPSAFLGEPPKYPRAVPPGMSLRAQEQEGPEGLTCIPWARRPEPGTALGSFPRRRRMKGLGGGNVGTHQWGHGGPRLSPPPGGVAELRP